MLTFHFLSALHFIILSPFSLSSFFPAHESRSFVKSPALITRSFRKIKQNVLDCAYSHIRERYKWQRFPDDTPEIHELRLLREPSRN